MHKLSRRTFLGALPLAGAVAALPAAAVTANSYSDDAEFVAIPREAHDAIAAWADAQRASVKATEAYGNYVRPIGLRRQSGGQACTPEEKEVADRLFANHVAAGEAVGPAREKMMFALLRITRGGAHV